MSDLNEKNDMEIQNNYNIIESMMFNYFGNMPLVVFESNRNRTTVHRVVTKTMPTEVFFNLMACNTHYHYAVLRNLIFAKFGMDNELVGLEIGTRGGMTEAILCMTFPKLWMYAIDVNDDEKWIRESNLGQRVKFIYKKTDDAVNDVTEPLDFLFIDGSKEYEQNKRDFLNYMPKVKKGGLVISWQEGQWERVWWNGNAKNNWKDHQVSKGAAEIFDPRDIIFDGDLLWHVNV